MLTRHVLLAYLALLPQDDARDMTGHWVAYACVDGGLPGDRPRTHPFRPLSSHIGTVDNPHPVKLPYDIPSYITEQTENNGQAGKTNRGGAIQRRTELQQVRPEADPRSRVYVPAVFCRVDS